MPIVASEARRVGAARATMLRRVGWLVLAVGLLVVFGACGERSCPSSGCAGDDRCYTTDDTGSFCCAAPGAACTAGSSSCCTSCDPSGVCACIGMGEPVTCAIDTDCCQGHCGVSGGSNSRGCVCNGSQASCSGPDECCSRSCNAGVCACVPKGMALPCEQDSDCCFGKCAARIGTCCGPSSYSCGSDDECCSGTCVGFNSTYLGTCM